MKVTLQLVGQNTPFDFEVDPNANVTVTNDDGVWVKASTNGLSVGSDDGTESYFYEELLSSKDDEDEEDEKPQLVGPSKEAVKAHLRKFSDLAAAGNFEELGRVVAYELTRACQIVREKNSLDRDLEKVVIWVERKADLVKSGISFGGKFFKNQLSSLLYGFKS